MIKFEEYLQLNADDSIEQVMNGEWIQKSRSSWKIVDEKDNKLEIHNDGHDPELNGESWSVHSNTFAPKAFAFFTAPSSGEITTKLSFKSLPSI